jgi:hypothetical protein
LDELGERLPGENGPEEGQPDDNSGRYRERQKGCEHKGEPFSKRLEGKSRCR